jgi:Phosphoesterase family
MVSAWSARCKNHKAMDCVSDINGPKPAPPLYNDPLQVKIDKTTSQDVSEHPPGAITSGMAYTTSLINAVMRGPDWHSTAIFLSWDDWGGFYDHVRPPKIDKNGYGIRVPGLLISPYARKGYIDHQTLSFDAYLKFIEDDFMLSRRIDPKTDGRPDRRPTVRENAKPLGDLVNEFDFTKAPRKPKLLPTHPKTTLKSTPPFVPLVKSVTPGTGQVRLVWDVPPSDGGSAITHYLVTPYRNGVAQSPHTFPINDPYVYTDVITGSRRVRPTTSPCRPSASSATVNRPARKSSSSTRS